VKVNYGNAIYHLQYTKAGKFEIL